jgi:hypothetical protein
MNQMRVHVGTAHGPLLRRHLFIHGSRAYRRHHLELFLYTLIWAMTHYDIEDVPIRHYPSDHARPIRRTLVEMRLFRFVLQSSRYVKRVYILYWNSSAMLRSMVKSL